MNFREKQLVPKALFPISNGIFMQHTLPELANYHLRSTGQFSCIQNDCLTIEICVGDHLAMDGAAVGYLWNRQPDQRIAQYVPNWQKDYATFCEKVFFTDMRKDA